jgi:hypothetical protein
MPNIMLSNPFPPAPGLPPALAPATGGHLPQTGGSFQASPDELSKLLPMILVDSVNPTSNGECFPIMILDEEFSKKLIVHTYPNQDNARVENMGNEPRKWSINAIFTNHIDPDPSKGEDWVRGTLFPKVFLNVLKLCASKTVKVMQHPIYGGVNVQVVGYKYQLNSKGPRDGAFLTINLIETIADGLVSTPVPLDLISVGQQLNAAFQASTVDFPPPPGLSLSNFFGQCASAIQNVLNYPADLISGIQDDTLAPLAAFSYGVGLVSGLASQSADNQNSSNPTSQFNQSIYQFNNVSAGLIQAAKPPPLGSIYAPYQQANNPNIIADSQSSVIPNFNLTYAATKSTQSMLSLNNNPSKNSYTLINKALNATNDLFNYYVSLNNVETGSILEGLSNFMSVLQSAQDQISNSTSFSNITIQQYVCPSNITWTQLASQLNNELDVLISLNSNFNANYLFVPAQTVISYYQGSSSYNG